MPFQIFEQCDRRWYSRLGKRRSGPRSQWHSLVCARFEFSNDRGDGDERPSRSNRIRSDRRGQRQDRGSTCTRMTSSRVGTGRRWCAADWLIGLPPPLQRPSATHSLTRPLALLLATLALHSKRLLVVLHSVRSTLSAALQPLDLPLPLLPLRPLRLVDGCCPLLAADRLHVDARSCPCRRVAE